MPRAKTNAIPSPTVEEVARLVQKLDRQQKTRLLQLVPELQTIPLEEAGISSIPSEQADLAAYFDRKFEALSTHRPMRDDDPFLGGLTVAEFFALPDVEQARIWDEAHLEVERELGNREQPVRPDALPAR